MESIFLILTRAFGKARYAKVIVCLVLIAFGISSYEINKKLGVSLTTLRKYKRAFESGKTNQLFEFSGTRNQSALNAYEDEILKEFDKNPPKTLRDAQVKIQKITGINRSLHRIQVWLKKRAYEIEP